MPGDDAYSAPMSSGKRRSEITSAGACELLERALDSGVRGEILDALAPDDDFDNALTRLRKAMRSSAFPTAAGSLALHPIVQALDSRTRREGFHVLSSWDY